MQNRQFSTSRINSILLGASALTSIVKGVNSSFVLDIFDSNAMEGRLNRQIGLFAMLILMASFLMKLIRTFLSRVLGNYDLERELHIPLNNDIAPIDPPLHRRRNSIARPHINENEVEQMPWPWEAKASIELPSETLFDFIQSRLRSDIRNETLEKHFNAVDHHLECPIKLTFPEIPVRFNGHLYDYDSLIQLMQNNVITDPFTREEIQIAEHTIQADYEAQAKMDKLHAEIKSNPSNNSSLRPRH